MVSPQDFNRDIFLVADTMGQLSFSAHLNRRRQLKSLTPLRSLTMIRINLSCFYNLEGENQFPAVYND